MIYSCQTCGAKTAGIASMLCTFTVGEPSTITGMWCDALCKNGLKSIKAWRVSYRISRVIFQGSLEVVFLHEDIKPTEVLAAFCVDGSEPDDFERHRVRILAGDYKVEEVRLIGRLK